MLTVNTYLDGKLDFREHLQNIFKTKQSICYVNYKLTYLELY